MSDKLVDLTIVGGGPVGLFAAFYAGLRGMSVRIVDSLDQLGGQLVALYPEKYIYDMPGFPKVLAKDLAREMAVQGTQFEPELVLGESVETLESIGLNKMIVTKSGRELPSKIVVIAAGAGAFAPTKLGAEGEDDYLGKGLTYGVQSLAEFQGKRVAIVGGGDSAFDWCMALLPVAQSVTLIHRRDQFRAHEDSVKKVRESAVQMRLFSTVKSVHGDGRIESVVIENTQDKSTAILETDAVVVNIGYKSSLGALKDWGYEVVKTQIAVDPITMKTSLDGVFAIGDVATYPGKLKLIANGVGEAVTAVCFAKQALEPAAKLFPGHSSDRDEP